MMWAYTVDRIVPVWLGVVVLGHVGALRHPRIKGSYLPFLKCGRYYDPLKRMWRFNKNIVLGRYFFNPKNVMSSA